MTITNSSNSSFLLNFNKSFRRLLQIVADLRLAIALLLLIAAFSVAGTVIEQGESLAFYQANYPKEPALFGFLSWQVIITLGLNHVYSTWWFLSLLVCFGTSLTACTFRRQLPALKAAQSWQFYRHGRQLQKLALSTELATGSCTGLVPILEKRGYKVFLEDNNLYARKGIIGRIGPIIVHGAMLIILGGAIWGTLTGFLAQEMISSGKVFEIQNVIQQGPLAQGNIKRDWAVKVNRFWIDYTAKGTVDQFYSDLSVIDSQGKELEHQVIHVNKPLRYDGITFYQTDWGISGVQVQINNSPIFQLPMAQLNTQGKGRLWGTWIPTKPDLSEGVSLIARDLQGTVVIYDAQGNLYNAVRVGKSVKVNGVILKVKELIGSTGLQIKGDPGIPIVYTGFALLMLGVVMSYVSHSQIWAVQEGDRFYLGGKTNRAQVGFEREILEVIAEIR